MKKERIYLVEAMQDFNTIEVNPPAWVGADRLVVERLQKDPWPLDAVRDVILALQMGAEVLGVTQE